MQKRIIQSIFSEQILLLILFLILTLSCLTAQSNTQLKNSAEKMVVISTTGLNFRAKPFTNSAIIGKVGFGEEVEVIEHLRDTKFTLNSSYMLHFRENLKWEIPISGYWVKSKYRKQTGYLFSPYLCHPVKDDGRLTFGNEFILLYEGLNCFNNFHIKKDWHWYGAVKKNGAIQLEPIQLSYFMTDDEVANMGICANLDSYVHFIIGSKHTIPSTTIRNQIIYEKGGLFCHDFNDSTYQTCLNKLKNDFSIDLVKNDSIPWQSSVILKDETGKSQLLNPKKYNFWYPIGFSWKGDLDGDGQDDYIIHYDEKSSKTVLYLSSQASKYQIVAPVAIYYEGYCC